MKGHPSEERLNDYLDGLLDRGAEVLVREHLEVCAPCRRTLEATRRIVDRTRDLPRAIEPRRDLWTEVEEATRPVRPLWRRGSGARSGRTWARPAVLATAAALLVAVTASITFLLVQSTPRTLTPTAAGGGPGLVATPVLADGQFAATEAEHLRTTARMLEVLEERGNELAPETRQAIDASLRDIDAAIQRLREALAADPASSRLMHMLDDAYRWKIDVLSRAIRAART